MTPDEIRLAGRLAMVDEQLIEHVIDCEMKFCANMRVALIYIYDLVEAGNA